MRTAIDRGGTGRRRGPRGRPILAAALIASALLAPAPAAAGAELLDPAERRWLSAHDGAIRIGITVIPPQVLRTDGAYEGLSIDYIRLVERKLGCRFVLVPYGTWNELLQAARQREVDLIFAAQRTPERQAYLLFSQPYVELPNMILVRKDREGGAELGAMDGWTVAVSEGSAVHEHLRREHPRLELRPERDELAALMRLSMGEVDAMVVEMSRASYYLEKAGIQNLRVAGSAGLLYELRFAVRSDWPVLAALLDKGLAAVTADERREVGRRWVPVGERGLLASKVFRAWLAAGLAGVALLLAAVVAWNRALQRKVRQHTLRLREELAEREKAEQDLALVRFALDNVREAAFLADERGRFRFVNDEACRVLGHTRAELLQLKVTDIDADFSAQRWPVHWSELRARRALVFESRHRAKDGRTFPVEVAANYFEYGGQGYNLALVRDISERRRAEAESQRIEDQLRQAQKLEAVGKLAGGVAHDFNNLLTAILGSADELAAELGPVSPLREGVQDIQAAAQKAALLTRQLLAFGRKQPVQPRVVDLGEVVATTLRMLRRLIGEDVVLEASSEPGLGRVLVDPGQLEQVILNLAVNARDAMPAGGRITIEASNAQVGAEDARSRLGVKPGPYVVLAVTDTGDGMSEEVRSHLFEPFFTTKEVGKGTGLGLSTVWGIVKQSGGDIRVESAPGRGTAFRIYFPRVDAPASAEAAAPVAEAEGVHPEPTGTERILIVEDEPAVRAIAARALRAAGFAVVEADDGEAALRLLTGLPHPEIDLLVTDVVMPRMGGLDLAARLRERRPDLRVLFVSGYTDRVADLHEWLDRRTAFMEKPFAPMDLARAVRGLLDGCAEAPAEAKV